MSAQTVLVTGSAGLVGSECVRHFSALGHAVAGMDNNLRRRFFGEDGDTRGNLLALQRAAPSYRHYNLDVRDALCVSEVIAEVRPGLVIHAAAQPSHDYAAGLPLLDFEVNALGTLSLLEACRRHAPDVVFCYVSTNKVYGDAPNREEVVEEATRFENAALLDDWRGFDESLTIDQNTHSLFGCSKLAADLYVQEYGRYYGMKTVCFRAGCLTGGAHAGAEQHGFLAYLARCCKEGRPYRVYGHKGKQVRDQLHAADVARACELFSADPKEGAVYNIGGGRENSVSVLEAIGLVERATGKDLRWSYVDLPRKGDHLVWITDARKLRADYPAWGVSRPLEEIVEEVCR